MGVRKISESKSAQGHGPSGELPAPSYVARRKAVPAPLLSGGIPKGGTPPFGRAFGYFSRVRKVTPAERVLAGGGKERIRPPGARPGQTSQRRPAGKVPAGRLFRCGAPAGPGPEAGGRCGSPPACRRRLPLGVSYVPRGRAVRRPGPSRMGKRAPPGRKGGESHGKNRTFHPVG